MQNDTYDALGMQVDRAKKVIDSEEKLVAFSIEHNTKERQALEESKRKFEENLAFARSLMDISDDELAKAREKANIETDFILEEIDKAKIIFENCDVPYEKIVEIAHAKGYQNTQLQDLLTEEEISEADAEYKAIEKEFKEKTKLNKVDIIFLITAVALQVVRQYILDPMLKERRNDAGTHDESNKGNKGPGWYRVPTKDILPNKVPFDAIRYSDNETVKGFLKGQKNHRDVTLGHDPILGWVFGTANIMTGTITNCTFNSAHIKYIPGKGNSIHSKADTMKIFSTINSRISADWDGKLALVYALIREGIHLKSDVNTTHSLPLPGIDSLNPEFGSLLLKYGIDTAKVGTEMSISIMINLLISMIHRMIKPKEDDEKLYAVKTRKILLISNSIASASNIIAVGVAAGVGVAGENPDLVKKAINYLDVGGLIVTITRLFSDTRFISKVKAEFINTKLDEQLIEELKKLDEYLE